MVALDWRAQRRGERPTIYGRDRERSQLRELVDGAATGLGSLVLISGEAGIGKTTLVNDLTASARNQGALVLTGGCYDLTTTPPYGPWSEAIRDYAPRDDQPPLPAWFGNPEELEQVGSQTALFNESLSFFAAVSKDQPLVIVLEDLHWSDSASLEALRFIARSLSDIATLLVITYRDDEITRRHDLYQLLPLLVRESQAQRIYLNRLERNDIREIIAGRYELDDRDIERLVEHVSERSEGNPFFATEILQGLEDERVLQPAADRWLLGDLERTRIPVLLRQALEYRLGHLTTATRRTLQVAAVLGQLVSIDRWKEIVDLDADEFEQTVTEALTTRILEETANPGAVQFRHALLRETLYESLTFSRRRGWHRIAGEILAEIPNVDPDIVAHHFQEAGDSRAAHWLIQAGARAESSYALPIAASHYARAQALMEAEPDAQQQRGWLLFHIGHLLRYSDSERSLAYLEDAAAVAWQIDDLALASHSLSVHGLLRCFQGDLGVGLEEMESAIAMAEDVTTAHEQRAQQAIASLFPKEILAHPSASPGGHFYKSGNLPGIYDLTHTYVMWLAFAGRFHDAMRVGEEYIDQVNAATTDTLLIQDVCRDAYYGLATATYWLGRPEEARTWRTLALEAYETIGHRVLVRLVHHEELVHLLTYETDRVIARQRAALAATARIEGIDDHQTGGPGSGVLLDLIEGRWNSAREFTRLNFRRDNPYARFFRSWIYRVLGREQYDEQFAAAIQADIDDLLPDGPNTEFGQKRVKNTVLSRQLAADLALDALETGDPAIAHAWISAHDRWLEWSGAVLGQAESSLLWARYHDLTGDLDTALLHVEQALEHASNPRQPLALIAAHRYLGQLATEDDRRDEAAEHLQRSLELARRCKAPYEQALTMLAMAELAIRQGEINDARHLLSEVRATCKSVGAQRTLNCATELLAQLTDRHPAGLTTREVEVLEQAATGMTNAEIGETLYISPRTVAQHLRSVYNKLGVNSRTAAVTRWAELNSGE